MAQHLNIPPANDADRRDPAPGELELVRQLVNTIDWEDGSEELPTPAALRDWLAQRGLLAPGEPVSEADLRLALEVREALRSLLLAHNGAEADPEAIDTLNSAALAGPVLVRFGHDAAGTLAPAGSGVPAALGVLLGIVFRSMSDGSFERLKACPAHDCMWAFYDQSRNRSKQWCTMEVCGNRAKARSYRERRRSD
ncbi:MAG: CGNR zinc finger domain-containing protein [Thermoleophilaceae bacterium]